MKRAFRFKSVRTLIIVTVLPLILISLGALTYLSYYYSKGIVNNEIDSKMLTQLNEIRNSLETGLAKHKSIPLVLAKVVETSSNVMAKDNFAELLKQSIKENPDTFGAGIFYEPFKYKEDIEFFGPYAYKENGDSVYTDDLSDPEYNYHGWDWYLEGKNAKEKVVWSKPYVDPATNIAMVTSTVPFYDADNNFLGVATGDVDFTALQNMVTNVKVGKSGHAFMIDDTGLYIADKDSEKMMAKLITEDPNTSLAKVGNDILTNKQGKTSYGDEKGKHFIYYTPVTETGWILALSIPESELLAPIRALLTKMIPIVIIVIIFVFIIIWLFARYIRKQVSKVNDLATVISEGDLTQSIKVESRDELGNMSAKLNEMASKLRETVSKISTNLNDVVITSRGLSEGANQTQQAADRISEAICYVATGADRQTDITRETEDVVKNINAGMENIASNVQTVVNSSMAASKRAEGGTQVINKAIAQMNSISERVRISTEVVDVLGKKSGEIGQIVSLITSVSEQTNMLALNAAIEAARAGEQGRGFAVVADEVRKLAEQSSGAAKQIGGLIYHIQAEIENAVAAMSEGTSAVEDGKSMVGNAGEAFYSILKDIEAVSTQMQDISAVIQEIYAGTQTMVDSVEKISVISKESSDSAENVAAAASEQTELMKDIYDSAQQLYTMASNLKNDIDSFKI